MDDEKSTQNEERKYAVLAAICFAALCLVASVSWEFASVLVSLVATSGIYIKTRRIAILVLPVVLGVLFYYAAGPQAAAYYLILASIFNMWMFVGQALSQPRFPITVFVATIIVPISMVGSGLPLVILPGIAIVSAMSVAAMLTCMRNPRSLATEN